MGEKRDPSGGKSHGWDIANRSIFISLHTDNPCLPFCDQSWYVGVANGTDAPKTYIDAGISINLEKSLAI